MLLREQWEGPPRSQSFWAFMLPRLRQCESLPGLSGRPQTFAQSVTWRELLAGTRATALLGFSWVWPKRGSVRILGNAVGSGPCVLACVAGSGAGACRGAGRPVWTLACHRARGAVACGCRPDRRPSCLARRVCTCSQLRPPRPCLLSKRSPRRVGQLGPRCGSRRKV